MLLRGRLTRRPAATLAGGFAPVNDAEAEQRAGGHRGWRLGSEDGFRPVWFFVGTVPERDR